MQVSVQMQAYEKAKLNDELEEAIHIKNVVLPRLRQQVQPEEVVAGWQQPVADQTLNGMRAAAQQALGDADAAPFAATFSRDLRALAATDLELAALEHDKARFALQLLLELPVAEQARRMAQLHRLVQTVEEQMKLSVKALEGLPSDLDVNQREQALHSPRVQDLLRQLGELRKLGCLLASSREWHTSFFAASATAPLGPVARTAASEVRAPP